MRVRLKAEYPRDVGYPMRIDRVMDDVNEARELARHYSMVRLCYLDPIVIPAGKLRFRMEGDALGASVMTTNGSAGPPANANAGRARAKSS